MPSSNIQHTEKFTAHKTKDLSLTKIDNDYPGLCMFQAKHNDGQTEEHTYHNHGNALLEEAAQTLYNNK